MKLKYYLRGLGIGILVTAALFLSGDKQKQTMSDAEIIEKAKALGMIESPVLAELNETISEETVETVTEEEASIEETTDAMTEETTDIETVVESETSETESEIVEESSGEETQTKDDNTEDDTQEVPSSEQEQETGEEVLIVVNSGEGSGTVSRRMADNGLVDDAAEFDKFLMKNGYDKKISVGNHNIPRGATWEEMAKILCSRAR